MVAILATLLFSSFASAASPPLSSVIAAKLQKTSLRLNDSVNGSYCTAFPISEDGLALTALHCVINCLDAQKLVEHGASAFLGLADLSVVTNTAPQVACANLSVASLPGASVSIEATGASLVSFTAPFLEQYPKFYVELKTRGLQTHAGDFAIVKIKAAQPLSCLRIGHASAGQTIWDAGLRAPSATDGKKAPVFETNGGVIYRDASQSIYIHTLQTDSERRWAQTIYSDDGVVYSSASNNPGLSGGPVVTTDGTVIAVTSGYTVTPTIGGDVNELIAVSLDYVMKSLPSSLATMVAQKNSACH